MLFYLLLLKWECFVVSNKVLIITIVWMKKITKNVKSVHAETLKRHHYNVYLSDMCIQTHLNVINVPYFSQICEHRHTKTSSLYRISLRSVHTDTLKCNLHTVYLSDLCIQTHLNVIIIPYISQICTYRHT